MLLYHDVSEARERGPILRVSPDRFAEHLRWLADARMHCTSASALIERGFPEREMAMTFDDGFASARPACEAVLARRWTATVFVCPRWIDEDRPELLSWRDLREMAESGIEIGAHGLAHERLCGRDVERLTRSLDEARERIEQHVGCRVTGLAYPEGLASEAARRAAAMAGYRYACSTLPGRNGVRRDAFWLRRNEVHGTDDRRVLMARISGADDWIAPVKALEARWRCR